MIAAGLRRVFPYKAAFLLFTLLHSPSVLGEDPTLITRLNFIGLDQWKDFSAVETADEGKTVLAVVDEGATMHVLRRKGDSSNYHLQRSIELVKLKKDDEADLEALAIADGWVYVAGSHARRRKSVDVKKYTVQENLDRIQPIDAEKKRRQLLRVSLESIVEDEPADVESVHLYPRIATEEILEPFLRIPSKENGLDIEGLAVSGKQLLIGLRGPVLRGGYAVVLKTKFENNAKLKLLFVDLGGLGIRSLERVDEGFLILSGPVGDGPGDYSIYFWDGDNGLPGKDDPEPCTLIPIGLVPIKDVADDAKPEGLAVTRKLDGAWEAIVVYDGPPGGSPCLITIPIPENLSDTDP